MSSAVRRIVAEFYLLLGSRVEYVGERVIARRLDVTGGVKSRRVRQG